MIRKLKYSSKSQAALEFLTTYAWFFIIIIIVISTLAYFGILSPSKLLPKRCSMGPEIACLSFIIGQTDVGAGVLRLRLRNNLPEAITHLENALEIDEEDSMTNFYLAMGYRKSGDVAREAFYSARYFKINLDPDRALAELNRAKELVKADTPVHFRIMQEIEEIKREGL